MFSDFFKLSLWTDPITNGGFSEGWIVFYWAWWGSPGYFPPFDYAVNRSLSPDRRRRVRLFSNAVYTAREDPTMITRCFPRVKAV